MRAAGLPSRPDGFASGGATLRSRSDCSRSSGQPRQYASRVSKKGSSDASSGRQVSKDQCFRASSSHASSRSKGCSRTSSRITPRTVAKSQRGTPAKIASRCSFYDDSELDHRSGCLGSEVSKGSQDYRSGYLGSELSKASQDSRSGYPGSETSKPSQDFASSYLRSEVVKAPQDYSESRAQSASVWGSSQITPSACDTGYVPSSKVEESSCLQTKLNRAYMRRLEALRRAQDGQGPPSGVADSVTERQSEYIESMPPTTINRSTRVARNAAQLGSCVENHSTVIDDETEFTDCSDSMLQSTIGPSTRAAQNAATAASSTPLTQRVLRSCSIREFLKNAAAAKAKLSRGASANQ